MRRIIEILEAAINQIEFEKKNTQEYNAQLIADIHNLQKSVADTDLKLSQMRAKVNRTKEVLDAVVKIFKSEKAIEALVESESDKQTMRQLWRKATTEDWELTW